MSSLILTGNGWVLVNESCGGKFGSELVREDMFESSLMVVEMFYPVVFALYVDDNVAFLQNGRISRSSDVGVFKCGSQT